MASFLFTDVNEALSVLWHWMHDNSEVFERNSRNGRVIEAYQPVSITYTMPRRRVLFHPARDANPFFHLFEAIWMLAGREDVAWLARFNRRMLEFSDDGKTLVSAYGKLLWENGLHEAIRKLRKDPETRRAYVPIFKPDHSYLEGKDTPCNLGVAFLVRGGHLDMTVFNRSNDMIWGSLGANYVHFGFIQEYVAAMCGMEVGMLTQISSCFHLYPDFDVAKRMEGKIMPAPYNPYETGVAPCGVKILNAREDEHWQNDAAFFIDTYTRGNACERTSNWWVEPFFYNVAVPMFRAWYQWHTYKDHAQAVIALDWMRDAKDWQLAALEWLDRRKAHADAKEAQQA